MWRLQTAHDTLPWQIEWASASQIFKAGDIEQAMFPINHLCSLVLNGRLVFATLLLHVM